MKKILFILILFIGFSVFSQKSKYDTYRVSKGETITSIARKLGITPYDLIKLNPDATNGINIDEVLIVPSKNTPINKISTNTKTTTKPQISNIKINKGLVKAKDSIVDGFLYHTVKPLETVYSLSSKYNVSKRKVRRLNKLNKNGDISVGQVLKFPTSLKNSYTKKKEKTIVEDSSNDNLTNNYFIYLVKQKDTYYTLTKIYDVTEEKLKEINPVLNDGLKAGLEIRIPKPVKKTIVSVEKGTTDSVNLIEQPKYKIHVIEEQEGFFRLKELFGVTKEELIKVNPELVNGLLLGMEIKIPIKNEQSLFMEGDIHGKTLNVVMLLPFKADSNISFSDDSKNAKRLNGVTDFYLGSLMALDSIKKKGLSVNVKVFDTKKSDFVVNNILNTYDFEQTDLVLAPITFNQFKQVTTRLEKYNIPIISPVSTKDCSVLGMSNSIQSTPTKAVIENKMLDYILENVTSQNIVLIANEIIPNKQDNTLKIELIKSKLLKHDSIKNVDVIRMKDGYLDRELIKESIKEDKENWVILTSKGKEITSNTIENLAVFPITHKITLFSLIQPENINTTEKAYVLKSEYLNRLGFQYPVSSYIDNESNSVLDFSNKYRIKYNSLPTNLSYKGFDVMYDSLIRLANFNEKDMAFGSGSTVRLINQFKYKQNITKSFSNHGVFIVRYSDYKLEKVQ